MNKQKVLYPYNGILFGNPKEWSVDTCYNVEPWKHAKWKKPAIPALTGSFFTTEPPGSLCVCVCVCVCMYIYVYSHVAKSQTRLSNFTFPFPFHALEKEMATHSSVLAWRIPGMGELDGLPSMGSHRVGHDWSDLAAAAAYILLMLLLLSH